MYTQLFHARYGAIVALNNESPEVKIRDLLRSARHRRRDQAATLQTPHLVRRHLGPVGRSVPPRQRLSWELKIHLPRHNRHRKHPVYHGCDCWPSHWAEEFTMARAEIRAAGWKQLLCTAEKTTWNRGRVSAEPASGSDQQIDRECDDLGEQYCR